MWERSSVNSIFYSPHYSRVFSSLNQAALPGIYEQEIAQIMTPMGERRTKTCFPIRMAKQRIMSRSKPYIRACSRAYFFFHQIVSCMSHTVLQSTEKRTGSSLSLPPVPSEKYVLPPCHPVYPRKYGKTNSTFHFYNGKTNSTFHFYNRFSPPKRCSSCVAAQQTQRNSFFSTAFPALPTDCSSVARNSGNLFAGESPAYLFLGPPLTAGADDEDVTSTKFLPPPSASAYRRLPAAVRGWSTSQLSPQREQHHRHIQCLPKERRSGDKNRLTVCACVLL